MDDRAAALTAAARDVHAAARSHKQAAGWHRNQARQLMQRYEQLAAQLGELGITVQLEGQGPGRSPSHARSD